MKKIDEKIDNFLIFSLSVAVLSSTHNLCFRAKIENCVYPFKPQFYYIKVECKGVLITRTCYPDVFYKHRNASDSI